MVASRPIKDLWFCVGLLLLAFLFRAHAIEALPPFNDESLHIGRAEKILVDRDTSLTPYKLLVYYWIAFFRPEKIHAIFIGRTAVGLFALLGLAGTYALAKLMFNHWVARIAITLATFSPFLIFFDRLAFADPLTSVLGTLMLWMAVRMVRRKACLGHCQEAVWVGILGALVLLSKIIGAPFLIMPIIAYWVFGTQAPTNFRLRSLIDHLRTVKTPLLTTYITFGLIMTPFLLHLLERTVSGKYVTIVNNNLVLGLAEERPPHKIVLQNLETIGHVNSILHSPILWLASLVAIAFLAYYKPRETIFLGSAVILNWAIPVGLGAELSTRYLTLGVLPFFVMVGGGLSILAEKITAYQRPVQLAVYGGVGLWAVGFALPFILNAWHDPTKLHMPRRDQWEYFENFSAGYALIEAAKDIEQLPPSQPSGRVNVIGLVGSCHQMRLYLDNARETDNGPIWLTCPFFGWQGEFLMDVAEDIENRLQLESQVYLLIEPEIPFFDPTALEPLWQWEEVRRYSRPFDGMEVVLYHIKPLENGRNS